MKRPRIGLVSPYWSFWEGVVDDDPRKAHAHLVEQSSKAVGAHGDIVWSVGVDGLSPGLAEVDLIVVVVTMASPPAAVRAFLELRADCVVLVWALHASRRLPEPFTHQSITVRGATVGASMMTASLSRARVRHDAVLGDPAAAHVHDALRCAAAASTIRGSRVVVIGEPLGGYDFVLPPAGDLSRLGVEIVNYEPEEFAARAERAEASAMKGLRAELGESLRSATTADGEESALRFALALRGIVDAEGARAGTLNCHVPSIRTGTRWGGVAPCFALGRETSRGCPFTCTGDVNTALAMLLVSALGLPTMYHEMEAVDEVTDDVVLANSGEHDDRFAALAPAGMVANPWFPAEIPTPIVAFQVAAGPASLLAVTVVDGRLRVIVAEGQFTSRPTDAAGTMTASFRFATSTATLGWRDWVRAGAGHHACATDAHILHDMTALCRHLDIDIVSIGER